VGNRRALALVGLGAAAVGTCVIGLLVGWAWALAGLGGLCLVVLLAVRPRARAALTRRLGRFVARRWPWLVLPAAGCAIGIAAGQLVVGVELAACSELVAAAAWHARRKARAKR